jgi:aldehyde:ferredoxin oxidoreductase
MDKLFGWTGKLLHIDLTTRKVVTRDIRDYVDRFIGGKGIGEKIYWDLWRAEWEAVHQDSALIVMTGPLAATPAPSGSRWLVCGKSPSLYPENFASSNLGGFFGAQLKQAGYDGLIIQGKARDKVYLLISNEGVSIKNADHLWGVPVSKTMQAIRREAGDQVKIFTTGIGGENGIRFATIATDAGGSGSMGFGSVMGSKNIKAIAVHGTGTIPVAHPGEIKDIRQKIKRMTGEGYFSLYGSPPPLPETEVVRKIHCHGCPQGCWRSLYKASSGEEGVRKCQATFFYSMWDKERHGDLTKTTFLATSLINEFSLCTMELPGILTWLERCIENGVISAKETELPLEKTGTIEFLETFIRKIATREGFGDVSVAQLKNWRLTGLPRRAEDLPMARRCFRHLPSSMLQRSAHRYWNSTKFVNPLPSGHCGIQPRDLLPICLPMSSGTLQSDSGVAKRLLTFQATGAKHLLLLLSRTDSMPRIHLFSVTLPIPSLMMCLLTIMLEMERLRAGFFPLLRDGRWMSQH